MPSDERRMSNWPGNRYRTRPSRTTAMLASAVAFGSSAAGFAFAQASTTSRVRTESEMIGRAEAQGASHRRVPPPSQLPGPFKVSNAELTGPGLTTFSNIAARKCVVAREGIVRSGEFVVGWQNQPKRLLIAGQRAKIARSEPNVRSRESRRWTSLVADRDC